MSEGPGRKNHEQGESVNVRNSGVPFALTGDPPVLAYTLQVPHRFSVCLDAPFLMI